MPASDLTGTEPGHSEPGPIETALAEGEAIEAGLVDEEAPLSRRMGLAVVWGGLNSILLRLGGFVSGIVAARIIAPREFGVFAVALTVHMIIINVSALGVNACIVREPDDPGPISPTVATIAMSSSALLMVIVFAIAPTLARELGSVRATWPIRIMSINVLLAGIYAVPSALLAREFQQGRMLIAELVNFGTSTALLIVLGLAGAGAFALAWSYVAGTLVMTIMLIVLAPARYWPGFNRKLAGPLLKFGLPLAGANLIAFSVYNVDYVVVGHVLGSVPLGLYLLAFTMASWPSTLFNGMVTSVALPAFARVRHDAERLPDYVSTVVSALIGLALPISVLTIVVARPAIVTVYGPRWSDAAVALAMLALFGAVRVPAELFANVIVALGRPRALFLTQLLWLAALIPAMIFAVSSWGIKGAGIAHFAIAGGIVLPVYVVLIHRLTGVKIGSLARAVTPPLIGSAVAGCAAGLTVRVTPSPALDLIAGLAVGVAVYLLVLGRWFFRLQSRARILWSTVGSQLDEDVDAAVTTGPDASGLVTP